MPAQPLRSQPGGGSSSSRSAAAAERHGGDFLLRASSVWCPALFRMLKRTGYDEALVLKGFTHLALWCSCVISLTFVGVWFTDVFTLACYSTHLGDKKASYWPCIYESIGALVFFACFRDSVQMIAHYDDERQRVLLRKWRELELLRAESLQALKSAKVNVELLRTKVVQMMTERVEEYSQEVFTVLLPNLHRVLERLQEPEAGSEEAAQFEDLLLRLAVLLRDVLSDVEELAYGMINELTEENPEAYGALRSGGRLWEEPLQPWDEWMEKELPSLALRGRPRQTLRGSHFVLDMEMAILQTGVAFRGSSLITSGGTTMSRRTTRRMTNRQSVASVLISTDPAKEVARSVMKPVEELLSTPERFETRFERLLQKSSAGPALKGQRMGCGRPPWEPSGSLAAAAEALGGLRPPEDHQLAPAGCHCCMPRVVSMICGCISFLCCYCCCLGGCCHPESRCIRRGFTYAPKRLRIGCFWLQIHTKVHERLIFGLIFSAAYCAFYIGILVKVAEDFTDVCVGASMSVTIFKQCMLGVGRKMVGAIALLCYIPALMLCIYHIDRLDAVMETMETIWELEDVQKAIRAFCRSMDEVADQVVLLRAIEGRVLARADLVMRFGRKMGALAQPRVAEGPGLLRSAATQLVEKLELAAWELRPAAEWLRLSPESQEVCLRMASECLAQTRP